MRTSGLYSTTIVRKWQLFNDRISMPLLVLICLKSTRLGHRPMSVRVEVNVVGN
jgi:hypothetical protein